MTIRIHLKKSGGFGEYRNIFNVESLSEERDSFFLKFQYRDDKFIINKSEIVGLPEIVE